MDMNTFYNAKELAAYHATVKQSRGAFLGEELFPVERTTEMSISWVKGYNAKNIVLQPAAFDTKAVIRSLRDSERVQTELPLFKEAMVFTEEQRRKIIGNVSRYGEKIALDLMVPIYKQYGQLVDGAMVQAERMRMALLSHGKYVIEGNVSPSGGDAVKYDVNYDPSGKWAANNNLEIQAPNTWIAANSDTSDPLNDINYAVQIHAEVNGAVTARVLMNSATLRGIMSSESIRKHLRPLGGVVTRSEVIEFIEKETAAKVILNDNFYVDEAGITQKFFADGYVSLLPAMSVGQTKCGTTPTEFDLLNNPESGPNVAITDEGIAIQTLLIRDPVNIETIVSATLMPSFEGMQSVYVIKGY